MTRNVVDFNRHQKARDRQQGLLADAVEIGWIMDAKTLEGSSDVKLYMVDVDEGTVLVLSLIHI